MSSSIKGVNDEAVANAVLERVKDDLASLKPDELLQVSLDIQQAVATVFGVLPGVKRLREQIAKELPTFDIARFDKLEDYTLMLSAANAKYLAATQPPDDLAPLAEEAAKMRETMLAEATLLVRRGLVSQDKLDQLKGANGYKNVATDLMVLVNVMEEVWPQIQDKTLTTVDDLNTASRLSTRLTRVVGLREQNPALIAEAADRRVRAYTLLLLTYDDVRRAVAYLRDGQDDAETIAPSLHPGRPRPKKRDQQAPTGAADNGGGAPTPSGAPDAQVTGSGAASPPNGAASVHTPTASSAGGPFV
jgi:hypothetical protein